MAARAITSNQNSQGLWSSISRDRLLGKTVGEREHERDQPEPQKNAGNRWKDTIGGAAPNIVIFQIVMDFRSGHNLPPLVQRHRHPERYLWYEHDQQHSGDLQENEGNNTNKDFL